MPRAKKAPPPRVLCTHCGRMVSPQTRDRHLNAIAVRPAVQASQAIKAVTSASKKIVKAAKKAVQDVTAAIKSKRNRSPTSSHGSPQLDNPGAGSPMNISPILGGGSTHVKPRSSNDVLQEPDGLPTHENDSEHSHRSHTSHNCASQGSAPTRDIGEATAALRAHFDPYILSDDSDDDDDTSSTGGESALESDFDFESTHSADSEEEDEELQAMIEQWEEMALELTEQDEQILRAWSLKIDDNLNDATYNKFQFTFPSANLPSFKVSRTRVQHLADFFPRPIDCCINSCIAYTGIYASHTHCPYCKEPRYNAAGKPRKRYNYLSPGHRLRTCYQKEELVRQMDYRHNFKSDPNVMKDVFDGEAYQTLRNSNVSIGGLDLGYKYFSQPSDIALGLSTDGFSPWRRRKKTCWPLILYNLNLPPDIRTHLEHILCAGVIPGPNKPKDIDSFLVPLVDELLDLAKGIKTFDPFAKKFIQLRAFLLFGCGDMPAMSMIMRMKGHNGIYPCRMCLIRGIRVKGDKGTAHYVPLSRPDGTPDYDPKNLPLRHHQQFMNHARKVQLASSQADHTRKSKRCGINGIPILSQLPTLEFPRSFPLDFMHLVWENLIKNLVLFFTGKFKKLDHEGQPYQVKRTVWDAIGKAAADAGATIPGAFGSRPQDVSKDKIAMTAETWSFWALYLGPIFLERAFDNEAYYLHFVELIRLLNMCLQYEMPREDIPKIREGFQKWVVEYENLYYQHDPARLSACPVTVHALLHIADGIEFMGPVWVYWAFPMERYCGRLSRCIKSRRFPWANLDNRLLADVQLREIAKKWNCDEHIAIHHPHRYQDKPQHVYALSGELYDGYALIHPRRKAPQLSKGLKSKLLAALATRYSKTTRGAGVPVRHVRHAFREENVESWGKLRVLGWGDTMLAADLNKMDAADRRDATFIRYHAFVDQNARYKNRRVKLKAQMFFGQLKGIYHIRIPPTRELKLTSWDTVVLAEVQKCEGVSPHRSGLDIYTYTHMGGTEIVDITTIFSLIGRVEWEGSKNIIDRCGHLAQLEQVLAMDEEREGEEGRGSGARGRNRDHN